MVEIMTTLDECAHNDPMTGLYNRMGFEKVFERKDCDSRIFLYHGF